MAFLDITFPTGIGFHRVGGSGFNTTVVATSSGQEYRNANWANPRAKYTLSLMTPAQIGGNPTDRLQFFQDLRAFFLQTQGKRNSFWLYDHLLGAKVPVRFDTDEFNVQVEPSDVAGGQPVVSWNSVVLVEVRPPNF